MNIGTYRDLCANNSDSLASIIAAIKNVHASLAEEGCVYHPVCCCVLTLLENK